MSGLLYKLTHRKKSQESKHSTDSTSQQLSGQQPTNGQPMYGQQMSGQQMYGQPMYGQTLNTDAPVPGYPQSNDPYGQVPSTLTQQMPQQQPMPQLSQQPQYVSTVPSGASTSTASLAPRMADERQENNNILGPHLPPRPVSDSSVSRAEKDPSISEYASGTVSGASSAASGKGEGGMIRSEEELHIRTERKIIEKVILRKKIKTEYVTQTFPVRKEYIEIERVAVGDDESGTERIGSVADEDLAALANGLVLCEERIVVTKEIVPVEKIRLIKKIEHYNALVEDNLRKERVVFDQSPNLPAPILHGVASLQLDHGTSVKKDFASDSHLFNKDKVLESERTDRPRDVFVDQSV